MTGLISTFISLAIISAYMIFERIRFGEQESISATAYNTRWNSWLFTIAIALTAVTLWIGMINIATPLGALYEFLSFLICGGMLFVSATPHYRTEGGEVHYTAAYTMAVASQVWVILINPWLLLGWIIVGIAWLNDRSIAWWSEIVCMITLYASLIITGLKQIGCL